MQKLLAIIFFLMPAFFFSVSHAYASTVLTENFNVYNLGNLTGQGGWQVASASGNLRFQLVASPYTSPYRSLQTIRQQNQVLPIAIYKDISIPATGLVNLAFQYRLYAVDQAQRIGLVDSNGYMICGFGQDYIQQSKFRLDIPYSTMNANWGYTTGQFTYSVSGVTTGVWYYPIIKMNFTDRSCKVSLDNGVSWSGTQQMYSEAGAEGSTLDKIVITHPETSTSPAYGAYISYIDDMQIWTGIVYGAPPDIGDINLSTFSATDSGYLTYDLSGHVGYTSENLTTCEVDIFQQNINNTSPMFYNAGLGFEGTVILWNTNLTDYTQIFPNNVYIGHGYSEADDSWFVNGFKVHYYAGQDTKLLFDYTCYEQYGTGNDIQVYHSQGVNPATPDYNSSLVSTPSGLLNSIPVGETICNDWFCNFKEWISTTAQWLLNNQFTNTFIFNGSFASSRLTQLTNALNQKIPFAYIAPLAQLNLSNIGTSTSSASLSFPLKVAYGGNTYVDVMMTGGQDFGILAMLRTALNVIFGLFFVIYLIALVRRVF